MPPYLQASDAYFWLAKPQRISKDQNFGKFESTRNAEGSPARSDRGKIEYLPNRLAERALRVIEAIEPQQHLPGVSRSRYDQNADAKNLSHPTTYTPNFNPEIRRSGAKRASGY